MRYILHKLHKQMAALEGEVREVKQDVSHWKTQISGVEDKVDQQGKRMSTFFTDVKRELDKRFLYTKTKCP